MILEKYGAWKKNEVYPKKVHSNGLKEEEVFK